MTEAAAWAILCVFAAMLSVFAAWDARRSLRFAVKLRDADERIMQAQLRYQATMQQLTDQLGRIQRDFKAIKERQ